MSFVVTQQTPFARFVTASVGRPAPEGHCQCPHVLYMLVSLKHMLCGHSQGCIASCAIANTKTLGISFLMHSSQVAIVTPRPVGCHEVAMGDERCERCSTWSHAVSRQTHGASSFPMIRVARPGALVAMGQAVIHMLISCGWLVDRRTGDSHCVEGGNFA